MSSIGNAGFGCLENYISDVAVTVMVGLGYYLFKGLKRKTDDFSDPEAGLKNLKGKLEGALQRWQYAKSIEEYNELIKSDYNNDGIEDPFSIINIMNKNGILPNIDTYNALLLNSYSKNNDHYAELLKEEILDPCGPVTANNFTLNVLIKGLNLKYKNIIKKIRVSNPNYNKQELWMNFDTELITLLKILEDRNIYMDLIGQNTILDSLVDQGRLNEAWSQYTSMKKKFKPDMYTYSTILRGIKKTPELSSDWLDKAFLILNEAKIKNEIDETFFNSLLDSCVKFNRIDKAENLFKENENVEKKNNITEHSYSIMIKGYSKLYKLDRAEQMFNEIKNKLALKDQKLNIVTYGAMLNACSRCKNIEKAELLLKEMEENHLEINSYIYSTLINGYRISRKFDKAIELFDKIILNFKKSVNNQMKLDNENLNSSITEKENDLSFEDNGEKYLNIVFFNSILDCCVESNKIDKMNEIYEFLVKYQKCENFPKIDMITYSIIIKGFAKSNRIEKVTEVYNYLRTREDFKLDEMLYNTIIDCYAKHNDENNAIKIFEDMKKLKISISVVTFGVLIKLYINVGNSIRAFELFDECVKNDIKPSVVIYQMLIKMHIKSKSIDKAINLFRSMTMNNIKSDQLICELIIKGCLDQSREKEAADFILNALNEGIKIENYIIANFVEKIQGENNLKHHEKVELIPKLIDAITTKSANIELHSLNILKKINQSFRSSFQRVQLNETKLTEKPNTSIYGSEEKNSEKNTSNYTVSAGYNFNSNQGISDLKGFYKNYITLSNPIETPMKTPTVPFIATKTSLLENAPVFIPTKFRTSTDNSATTIINNNSNYNNQKNYYSNNYNQNNKKNFNSKGNYTAEKSIYG